MVTPSKNEPSLGAWMRFVRKRFPGSYPIEPFTELVYDAEAAPFIAERWPAAKFLDASDIVHEGRFEVTIPDIDGDDFYPVMILEGWSGCCLSFELSLRIPEGADNARRWINKAKVMKEAGYVARP